MSADEVRTELWGSAMRVGKLLQHAGLGYFATWQDVALHFPGESMRGRHLHTIRDHAAKLSHRLCIQCDEIKRDDAAALLPLRAELSLLIRITCDLEAFELDELAP